MGLEVLQRMETRKTIDARLRAAGDEWHEMYQRAQSKASGSSFGAVPSEDEQEIIECQKILGGSATCGGSCAEYVLGEGESIDKWAKTRAPGAPGHPMHVMAASGALRVILEIIYGRQEQRRQLKLLHRPLSGANQW